MRTILPGMSGDKKPSGEGTSPPMGMVLGPMGEDSCGLRRPYTGKNFAVDAHSKWPEAKVMFTTTAACTITALREMFARYGIPLQLVSDNGPQVVSEQLAQFLALNGVQHIRTVPYHPSSNGAAERLVQTVKRGIRAGLGSGISVDQALHAVMLQLRTAPHATTGCRPVY